MRQFGQKKHSTDLLFILALFCVFVASALMVVLIGANSYRSTTSHMQDAYTSRTALLYVCEKVRQNDAEGAVALGTIGDQTALTLTREYDGKNYVTYIYEYNHQLKELFVAEGLSVSPEQGQTILEVEQFEMEESEGLYRFTTYDQNGRQLNLSIRPHCS